MFKINISIKWYFSMHLKILMIFINNIYQDAFKIYLTNNKLIFEYWKYLIFLLQVEELIINVYK